jgi:hypothetical protein
MYVMDGTTPNHPSRHPDKIRYAARNLHGQRNAIPSRVQGTV